MNISNKPQLIGLSGTFASGKDSLANYLVEHFGYSHPSTSAIVRTLAMKEEGSVERPILQIVAERYRKLHGAGIFAKMACESAPRPTIVTGLRSLGEAKEIKNAGGIIVFVDAPVRLRYERMVARDRDLESRLSFEDFQAGEAREWHAGDDDADFNLRGIKEMADILLDSSAGMNAYIETALAELSIT